MPSVLVVDDEPVSLAFMVEVLEAAGHAMDVAHGGLQAIARLEARAYDAVVIEVIMPQPDGVRTIAEVRRRWPDCPVVAVSGGGRLVDAAQALTLARAVGADAVLEKPFTADDLVQAVAAAIAARGA